VVGIVVQFHAFVLELLVCLSQVSHVFYLYGKVVEAKLTLGDRQCPFGGLEQGQVMVNLSAAQKCTGVPLPRDLEPQDFRIELGRCL
jgi:hypothetical protein